MRTHICGMHAYLARTKFLQQQKGPLWPVGDMRPMDGSAAIRRTSFYAVTTSPNSTDVSRCTRMNMLNTFGKFAQLQPNHYHSKWNAAIWRAAGPAITLHNSEDYNYENALSLATCIRSVEKLTTSPLLTKPPIFVDWKLRLHTYLLQKNSFHVFWTIAVRTV